MSKVQIKVNGKEIELTEFPARIIINVLYGLLKSLRGVEEIQKAEFVLEK